jgi:chitinase
MPFPLSSLTCKLFFLAIWFKLSSTLTVQKVHDLLHVDLEEAALDIELDGLVGLINALKKVSKHTREQALKVFVVVVGSLHRYLNNGEYLPP